MPTDDASRSTVACAHRFAQRFAAVSNNGVLDVVTTQGKGSCRRGLPTPTRLGQAAGTLAQSQAPRWPMVKPCTPLGETTCDVGDFNSYLNEDRSRHWSRRHEKLLSGCRQ